MAIFNALKVKRSAGMRVTRAVHAAITKGNVARGRFDWGLAAQHYEQALTLAPELTHIWIQIGHMYKEDRAWERAVYAYAQAAKLAPTDPAVIGWLFEIAGRLGSEERQRVTAVLETSFPNAVFRHPKRHAASTKTREIVFDVSDLVAYFARARVPTGIQRVQIEVIRALSGEAKPPRICCAIEGRDAWVEISTEVFDRITDIATGGTEFSANEWVEALAALQLSLLLGDTIIFGDNAVLLNLGTSWWLQNYFLQVRNAQAESNIEYVPFVHDLIPIMAPQHCVEGLVEDFVFWATSVFNHASRFLVPSEATKRDLLDIAHKLGHNVSADAVTVVPLGAAFAKPERPADVGVTLSRFGLATQPFILFVSTIESRKGHVSALHVWQRLLERHGSATPKLVCVGNNGWLNEQFYELLNSDSALREHVILLSKISDYDLGFLYESCLFTIYPSTYEGWGLPVTEALSYGKPVVTADNSSLPEAGGALASYFKTGDLNSFTELVEQLSFDHSYRDEISRRIVSNYRPRDWGQVARQITDFAVKPTQNITKNRLLISGEWYNLSRSRERSIWHGSGSSEIFRAGDGWADVDRMGAWIRADGASLTFDSVEEGRFNLAIRLLARAKAEYRIKVDGKLFDTGVIDADASQWAVIQLDRGPGQLKIDVTCRPLGEIDLPGVSRFLCVTGFSVYNPRKESQSTFVEAVALGRLDRITAFRQPFNIEHDAQTNVVDAEMRHIIRS